MIAYYKNFTNFLHTLYFSEYLFNSFITTLDNINTAIKFGTAKNKVTASDKFIIDWKFIAEPAIIHKQYKAWNIRVFKVLSPNKKHQAF